MIKGNMISFRPVQVSDAEVLCKWYNNGELMKHVGFNNGLNTSEDKLSANIAKEVGDKDENRSSRRFIVIENSTDMPIGEVSFGDLDLKNKSCEIGIKICDLDKQGMGYGYDALNTFLDYLFKTYNLHRIELDTLLENVRAQHLYEKVGFKRIGLKRDCWLDPQNCYRSAILMDILREEFYYEEDN